MEAPKAISELERKLELLSQAVEALASGSGVEEDRWQAKQLCEQIRREIEESRRQGNPL